MEILTKDELKMSSEVAILIIYIDPESYVTVAVKWGVFIPMKCMQGGDISTMKIPIEL